MRTFCSWETERRPQFKAQGLIVLFQILGITWIYHKLSMYLHFVEIQFSVSKLDVNGFSFKIGKGCFSLFNKDDSFISSGILVDGLYRLKIDVDFSASLMCIHQNIGIKHSMANKNSTYLWHKRLGHISKKRLQRLVKNEILSNLDFAYLSLCMDCIK